MILPRLEAMARLAGDSGAVRDPVTMAELRDTYRYLASVSRTILPHLEPELAELPPAVAPDAGVEERISFQMSLVKRTNRLHRAVAAYLADPATARRQAV